MVKKPQPKPERKSAAKKKEKPVIVQYFVLFTRWSIIIGCLAFVVVGWLQSASKYFSKHTAVSIMKNESKVFTFPSISFCPHFKSEVDLILDIIKPAMDAKNLTRFDQLNFTQLIAPRRWELTEFLKIFSHSIDGDSAAGSHILFNKSYWEESIPHVQFTGQCFTYNPPFESSPGLVNGLRMGFSFPNTSHLNESDKQTLLSKITIFLHDKGHLFYYREDDRPSHKVLDISHIQYMTENRVALKYSRYTALNTDQRKCSDDPAYDFRKCVEKRYSKLRGCQPPWYFFPDIDIPICNDLKIILQSFLRAGSYYGGQYFTLPYLSTTQMADFNSCPVPCTTSDWSYEIQYEDIKDTATPLDNGSEWIIFLWFKNFFFEYGTEYVICDYTCLLGEIGGNLGFFLGGSVVAYVDVIMGAVLQGSRHI